MNLENTWTWGLVASEVKVNATQLCLTLCDLMDCNSPWNSPGQNTGVGSLSLFQGIFPTQGLNLTLPRCRQILYQLNHKESLRILEWVAYPFFRGSSQPRNQIGVSYVAGGFFTNWAIKEARSPVEPTKWLEAWNFQSHLLTSGEGRGFGDWVASPMANNSINCAYRMKPERIGFRELLGCWTRMLPHATVPASNSMEQILLWWGPWPMDSFI